MPAAWCAVKEAPTAILVLAAEVRRCSDRDILIGIRYVDDIRGEINIQKPHRYGPLTGLNSERGCKSQPMPPTATLGTDGDVGVAGSEVRASVHKPKPPAPPPPYSLKCHHNGRGEDPGQGFDMGKGRSGTLRASAMSFMPHTTPT